MRKTLFLILLLVLFISLAYGQENRKGLAILEFKAEGDVPKATGTTIADLITNRIDPKQFFIVERSQLSKIIGEKLYGADDIITEEQTKKLKVLNVSYLMLGNVSKIENFYYGGYRIVDVDSGQLGIRDSIVGAKDFREFVEMIYTSLMKGNDPFIKDDMYIVLKKSWFEQYKQDLENTLSQKRLYFTSSLPHNTIVNTTTLLNGLSYTIEIEGLYNIDYGGTLYFGRSDGMTQGIGWLYLCINGNISHGRQANGEIDPFLEIDCHYQISLKKGDLIEIKACRVSGTANLHIANHPQLYHPAYLRLTKVGLK